MPINEFVQKEHEILEQWKHEKTFEQSLKKKSPNGDYVFYDGPPFATGLPHYGHIVGSIMKDMVPRYWTMRGYHVERRWGWDCHGLPIENIIEKELKVKSKRDIEAMGVAAFNAACLAGVLKYVAEWKKFIPRIGRWVDMDHSYTTMDTSYTESIWWAWKQLCDKGLVYEGKKSMHICPRCGTPLSNFEVTQGYKDVKDLSVIVKFSMKDEPGTSLLVWTTTPWTLPGNVAAAVNEDVDYTKAKVGDETYIVAEARVAAVLPAGYEVIGKVKGKELIGRAYTPLFPVADLKSQILNKENGWKIVSDKGIDFVTLDDGTGIVHMAPAFGEDDMRMGEKHNLPFIQHVDESGRFTNDVKDFVGLEVKPKGNPRETDEKIVAWLEKKGLVFSKSLIEHSYPHCWRCDTPLLNYAASSWFVKVTELKERMMKHNKNIHWVPEHVQEGRFGKWLEGARDWAVSRSRYWGAPIPVWKCTKTSPQPSPIRRGGTGCGKIFVAGAIADIPWPTKLKNTYFLLRHGEAEHNVKGLVGSHLDEGPHRSDLTAKGKKQAKALASSLKGQQFDIVYTSPIDRVQTTAAMVAKTTGAYVIVDDRLREISTGDCVGKTVAEWREHAGIGVERWTKASKGGESLTDLWKRLKNFMDEMERTHTGKRIIIASHGDPLWLLNAKMEGRADADVFESWYPKVASLTRLYDVPVDLHRPHIDNVTWPCECGGEMRRVPEVFDCWFESGSMPYAQQHYPFENRELFHDNFPAEFIAEGMDQTRGWFYTLVVLSTALFNKPPFKNVIVNGIVLAENGEKMSKRLNNYPDPMLLIEKYGADALRYYLMASPVVEGENMRFAEKGVDEVYKKVVVITHNVVKFWETFQNIESKNHGIIESHVDHVLDRWIMARLEQLVGDVTKAMDEYKLVQATRPIGDFINDLSTWYVRRSRDRFKDGDPAAIETLRTVLTTLAKVMAPVMPFLAEHVYQKIMESKNHRITGNASVHLEVWPTVIKSQNQKIMESLIDDMDVVRKIVELGHAARESAGVKVRQALASLELGVKSVELYDDLIALIRDELNVKDARIVKEIVEHDGWVMKTDGTITIALDTRLTDELKAEGLVREIIRTGNALRKEQGLTIQDTVSSIQIDAPADLYSTLDKEKSKIVEGVRATTFEFTDDEGGSEILFDGKKIFIRLKR